MIFCLFALKSSLVALVVCLRSLSCWMMKHHLLHLSAGKSSTNASMLHDQTITEPAPCWKDELECYWSSFSFFLSNFSNHQLDGAWYCLFSLLSCVLYLSVSLSFCFLGLSGIWRILWGYDSKMLMIVDKETSMPTSCGALTSCCAAINGVFAHSIKYILGHLT